MAGGQPRSASFCALQIPGADARAGGFLSDLGPDRPPLAPVKDVVDTHFGQSGARPLPLYRGARNPEVQAWLRGQADLARSTLDLIPGRRDSYPRLEELGNAPTARVANVRINGDSIYSLKRLPATMHTPKLYVRKGFKGKDRLLVDPGSLSGPERGPTRYSISYYEPSPDNQLRRLRHRQRRITRDTVLHVLDVRPGQGDRGPDRPGGARGARVGLSDHRLFYTRLQKLEPGAPPAAKYLNACAYLHTLGTDPARIRPCSDPEHSPSALPGSDDVSVRRDGRECAMALWGRAQRRAEGMDDLPGTYPPLEGGKPAGRRSWTHRTGCAASRATVASRSCSPIRAPRTAGS